MKETTFQYLYTMTNDLDSLLFHCNVIRLPWQRVILGVEALSSPMEETTTFSSKSLGIKSGFAINLT